MGFRTGAFCKCWDVENVSPVRTKVRLSISQKNKQTGEYDQTFSGFVMFVGSANAQNAAKLTKDSRIKLGECDVTTRYDKEKKITYTNFTCFSFESADGNSAPAQKKEAPNPKPAVDEGYDDGGDLPW